LCPPLAALAVATGSVAAAVLLGCSGGKAVGALAERAAAEEGAVPAEVAEDLGSKAAAAAAVPLGCK